MLKIWKLYSVKEEWSVLDAQRSRSLWIKWKRLRKWSYKWKLILAFFPLFLWEDILKKNKKNWTIGKEVEILIQKSEWNSFSLTVLFFPLLSKIYGIMPTVLFLFLFYAFDCASSRIRSKNASYSDVALMRFTNIRISSHAPPLSVAYTTTKEPPK